MNDGEDSVDGELLLLLLFLVSLTGNSHHGTAVMPWLKNNFIFELISSYAFYAFTHSTRSLLHWLINTSHVCDSQQSSGEELIGVFISVFSARAAAWTRELQTAKAKSTHLIVLSLLWKRAIYIKESNLVLLQQFTAFKHNLLTAQKESKCEASQSVSLKLRSQSSLQSI